MKIRYKALSTTQTEQRLAALKALGIGDAALASILDGVTQTDKSAQQMGVAFKSADVVYVGDVAGVIQDGRFVALKATPPAPPAEQPEEGDEPEEEEKADGTEGDMMLTPAEIDAIASAVANKITGMLDELSGRMAAVDEELKGRGYQRMKEAQEDANAVAIAALTSQLAELRGDQPAAITAPDAEAIAQALKGGPTQPAEHATDPWQGILERIAAGVMTGQGSNADVAAALSARS